MAAKTEIRTFPPQKMLGPSQVSVVLGYSKFQTREELQNRIENGTTEQQHKNDPKYRGCTDEPKALSLYRKYTGDTVHRCAFAVDPHNRRFGGIGDGLVGSDGGVEVKCQYGNRDPMVYMDHRIQAVCYMYLYRRPWWDIIVCSIAHNETQQSGNVSAIIERVYFADYQQIWDTEWYPAIRKFTDGIKWRR